MESLNGNLATSYVSDKESIEYMLEGLKQAASAARELGKAQSHPIWVDIGLLLDEIHNRCLHLSTAKSLGRQKTLQILDNRENVMSKKLEETRPTPKPKFLLN